LVPTSWWAVLLWLPLSPALTWASAVDLDVRRLPDRSLAAAAGLWTAVVLGLDVAIHDHPRPLVEAAVAAIVSSLIFFLLHLTSPDGLGFGDVKLVAVLTADSAGTDGWPTVVALTDTNFAARLAAARKAGSLTQQQLADRSGAHVTQIRRYEAGTSQPTLDVLRALALALNVSADSLLFDDDERGPHNPTLRLKLEAVDQFTPDEQEHVAAFIEGALLRHHARQAFSGQAS
jgi:transcriptional regulator with XRE-family HTH domain